MEDGDGSDGDDEDDAESGDDEGARLIPVRQASFHGCSTAADHRLWLALSLFFFVLSCTTAHVSSMLRRIQSAQY